MRVDSTSEVSYNKMSLHGMPNVSQVMMKGAKLDFSSKSSSPSLSATISVESRHSMTLTGVRGVAPDLTRDRVSSHFIRFMPSHNAAISSRLPNSCRFSDSVAEKPTTHLNDCYFQWISQTC